MEGTDTITSPPRHRQRRESQSPRHHRRDHARCNASSGSKVRPPPRSGSILAASAASARSPCRIFPDPVTGRYKDAGWQVLGDELKSLLTPEEYASAKRTTFNAFYTSPTVIAAMHRALDRLGVPAEATALEPGCGTGNFIAQAADGHAVHRRRARRPLRPDRPRAAPASRHPHREFPRHPAAGSASTQ